MPKPQRGIQTKGAAKKRNATERRASARRAARAALGEPLVQPKGPRELDGAAREFLAKHKLIASPSTLALARIHLQMQDAVDAVYDVAVRQQKEQRQISAMVSAAKISIATLEKLGLPGDELELEETARDEAIAEAAKPKPRRRRAPASAPAAQPDELEAYE